MDTSTKVLSPTPSSVGGNGNTVSYSPPQTNSSSTGNIVFTILLCGFGLLLIYVIFRIKKLEMTMTKLEQRHQQVVQNGIRDWFQVPENMHYLQHNLGRNPPSSVLSVPGPSGEDLSQMAPHDPCHQHDHQPPSKPAANPLSGLMGMCGMDLLGSMMSGGMNPAPFSPPEVFGVSIGAMPAADPPPPPPQDSKIVEISDGEGEEDVDRPSEDVNNDPEQHEENNDNPEIDEVNNESEQPEEHGITEIDVDEEEASKPAAKKRSYTRRQAKK